MSQLFVCLMSMFIFLLKNFDLLLQVVVFSPQRGDCFVVIFDGVLDVDNLLIHILLL